MELGTSAGCATGYLVGFLIANSFAPFDNVLLLKMT
jgi:hypothetical protein